MKCPNCGASEKARFKVCPNCNEIFATDDFLEYHQLEYLVKETASWKEVETLRDPYVARLEQLKARLRHIEAVETKPIESIAEPVPVVARVVTPAESLVPEAPSTPDVVEVPKKPTPLPEPAEKVPFDQWLLSERNIKIALYSGGTLLVLAGLIFVGVNWARIPGLAKFGITLFVTLMTFLGGYLLYRRPTLTIGGVALMAIGSGFVPLNFAVLQIYIFADRGLSPNTMWLIGSLPCLLLYTLIAYWTQTQLFTYFSMAALVSALTAVLVLVDAPLLVYALVYALLAIVLLLGGKMLRSTKGSAYIFKPTLIVSQAAMLVIFIFSMVSWMSYTGCTNCPNGSPWLAITTMFLGVVFYVTTNLAVHDRYSPWAAAFGFAFTFGFTCIELNFSNTGVGVALMVLALVYLVAGYLLERVTGKRSMRWPLYVVGYMVAGFVTFQALAAFLDEWLIQLGRSGKDLLQSKDTLAKILVGDVLLLVITAWIHRQYKLVYAAAWLFIVPVYLFASIATPNLTIQGWVLFALLFCYAVAGYFSGRRELWLGAPFLTAAAGLSVIVPILTWGNSEVTSLLLPLIAGLYITCALWQRWTWLLYPALVGVHLTIVTVLLSMLKPSSPWTEALSLSYAGLGVTLILAAIWLKQAKQGQWRWPLFIAAGLDITGSYITGLTLGGWIAIGLSVVFAALIYTLSWFERDLFAEAKLPPLLSYLGTGFAFVGHLYVLGRFRGSPTFWPPFTAGFCVLFLLTAWLIRLEPSKSLYGTPLRWNGMILMFIPLVGAVTIHNSPPALVAFVIAGAAYLWVQWTSFADWKIPPIFSYMGTLLLFIGHFYLIDLFRQGWEFWPPFTAGLCLLFMGLAWLLRGERAKRLYATPLRWVGIFTMIVPLVGALIVTDSLLTALTFALASGAYLWVQWASFSDWKFPPIFSYTGLVLLFVGHFYLIALLEDYGPIWLPISAGFCALYLVLAWFLKADPAKRLFGNPLRWSGSGLMFIPMVGAVIVPLYLLNPNLILSTLTFAIAGTAYLVDAFIRRGFRSYYLAGGAYIASLWALLFHNQIDETQAYAIPFGLALLVVGWVEHLKGSKFAYRWATLLGLLILMCTAFYQSLEGIIYAVLLLVESLLALVWGIRIRSKNYVQFGVISMVVNAIAQLGPAFVEMDRWIQLGIIGTILLGAGLAALFRRDQLLATRRRLTDEWKQWEA